MGSRKRFAKEFPKESDETREVWATTPERKTPDSSEKTKQGRTTSNIKLIISLRSEKSEPTRANRVRERPEHPPGQPQHFPPSFLQRGRGEYEERNRHGASPAKDTTAPSRLFSRYRMYKYTYGTKWIP